MKEMERFQKVMLRANKVNACTQVDEGELLWGKSEYVGKEIVHTGMKFNIPSENMNSNTNLAKLKQEDVYLT